MTAFVTWAGTIHDDVSKIAETVAGVAGYVTGTPDICWTAEDWARFKTSGKLRINQGEINAWDCDCFDVETGALTPAQAAAMASSRLKVGWNTDIYVSMSNAAKVTAALIAARVPAWAPGPATGADPLPGARLYVADYSLDELEAVAYLGKTIDGYTIAAVQWASPGSNPENVVPAATGLLTLAEANVNLTVALPFWFAYEPAAAPPAGWQIMALALLDELNAILRAHL